MDILIVRHAPAGDRHAWTKAGKDDAVRPLTPEGAKKMQKAAAGLVRLVPLLDAVATSPYARAAQTADILAERYPKAERAELPALVPNGDFAKALRWLEGRGGGEIVALVGHEPYLSGFISFLLTGRDGGFVLMKKGAAALVEFDGRPVAGGGVLRWLLQPAGLRELA